MNFDHATEQRAGAYTLQGETQQPGVHLWPEGLCCVPVPTFLSCRCTNKGERALKNNKLCINEVSRRAGQNCSTTMWDWESYRSQLLQAVMLKVLLQATEWRAALNVSRGASFSCNISWAVVHVRFYKWAFYNFRPFWNNITVHLPIMDETYKR